MVGLDDALRLAGGSTALGAYEAFLPNLQAASIPSAYRAAQTAGRGPSVASDGPPGEVGSSRRNR